MAKTLKLNELNKQYEFICNEWIRKFCKKQEMDFEHWIGDEVGGIAVIGDYCFKLSDIILDLNTKQPKGLILKWQNEDVDFNTLNKKPQHINYKSYTMGLRHKHLKKNK